MKSSGIIYYHAWDAPGTPAPTSVKPKAKSRVSTRSTSWATLMGIGMIALALGGLSGPLTPRLRLEAKYALLSIERTLPAYQAAIQAKMAAYANSVYTRFGHQVAQVPAQPHPSVPAAFDPLKTPDGASIDPVNKDFSLVIPKIGVNAAVIPAVNPTKPGEYLKALETGIAHSSLSYFPDEDGAVYLFSHSTNYDWFVGDLNAVFYLLKNLEEQDMVVLFYKGSSYTYKITGKQIVKPTSVSYLAPQPGEKRLILQTCWPPGSVTERLLIFADLVEASNETI